MTGKNGHTPDKGESVFEFKIGPAFLAVLVSIVISLAQFAYSTGQQAAQSENTKAVTAKLEKEAERQDNRQSSLSERVVKVETITGAIQSQLVEIAAKIDRLGMPRPTTGSQQ